MERPAFIAASLLGLSVLAGGLWPRPHHADPTRLRIETLPAGAEVLIDKERLGVTPLEVGITAGNHQLNVRLDGHAPLDKSVSCPQGQITLQTFRLGPKSATLPLTDLKGADVWLGPGVPEKLSGPGPWKLEPGEYEVTAKKGSLPAKPKKFRLKPGENRELSLQWPELPGQIPAPEFQKPAPVATPSRVRSETVRPQPPVPQWQPAPEYRPVQPPRAFTRPDPPPSYQPEPLWTPLPATQSEPHRAPPSDGLFTPLP